MTFGGHRLAAALVAGLLLCAGCTDDPRPKLSPPEPSSTAADPTPSQEPKEPWERKTDAGAVAFAEHWVGTLNEAGRSGDTGPLAALSAGVCKSCRMLVNYIDGVYAGGGRIEGSDWRVLEMSEVQRTPQGRPALTAKVRQAPARIHREGERVTTLRSETFAVAFEFEWSEGKWSATRADLLA